MNFKEAKYFISYNARKTARSLNNYIHQDQFAGDRVDSRLPHVISSESTPIFRKLPEVPRELFENKRTNLRLALEGLNGVLIPPGKIFSFWRMVGRPDEKRGFKDGLVISQGKASKGVGGGLCQLSNLIHWLALKSELKVIERHHHSLDLFPDDDRKIPFGTGATIFFNYKDLRLFNPTENTYQLWFELTPEVLRGRLGCSAKPEYDYKVYERSSRFFNNGENYLRQNSIWRKKMGRAGELIGEELLFENNCLCQYQPREVLV